MRTSIFENESRIQNMFGLRHRPDRFNTRENAFSFANGCTKPHSVVYVDENPDGIKEGWYVVCPADAERLHRETEGLITYAKQKGDTAMAQLDNTLDEQKQKRLKELEQTEAGLFEDYERGLIDDDTLNFELEGISVSRSILTEKKKAARRRKTKAVAW